jgi:hypothetical protein
MNIEGERELVLAFNGDVMLGRLVNEMISTWELLICGETRCRF